MPSAKTVTTPKARRQLVAAHRVLVVFGPSEGLTRALGSEPMQIGREVSGPADLELDDPEASRAHAAIEHADGAFRIRDLGSRNHTYLNAAQIDVAPLADGDVVRIGSHLLLFQYLTLEGALDGPSEAKSALAGESTAMRSLRRAIRDAASLTEPALVLGESGVGKELVARELHDAGPRRERPFVAVNCAALPEALAESELFGHARGAFTGATAPSAGLFGSADGGTLFLDEIGEMPLPLQAKLLRALSTGEVRPVGETKSRKVDVRVVAATNVDLEAAIADNRFRGDLYARLAGVVLDVPPLRARRDDVLPLARRFAAGATFDADAAEALLVAPWPYNVRQLEHTVKVAAHAARSGPIGIAHLPPGIRRPVESRGAEPEVVPAERLPIELRIRRDRVPSAAELREVLEHFEGNVSRIADFFGKDRKQIYRWAERAGMDLAAARGSDAPASPGTGEAEEG